MDNEYDKLEREQLQKIIDGIVDFSSRSIPKRGWIRTIRDTLGISSYILAEKLGCRRSNVTALEQRERKGKINLATLQEVAQALDCKLVYCLVPNGSLDAILEKRARKVAKKRISTVNRSMSLEQQGLSPQQLKQQEEKLVQKLLQGDPKKLWNDDEI